MPVMIEPVDALAQEIEERHVHGVEHVLYHPTRGSIVSLTTQALEEIDPLHGATIGETVFDLQFLTEKPSVGTAARQLEHIAAVGAHHVAAIFQSRNLVVWDLRDAVLQSVTEVEKQQKSVAALAASLCKDKWLFYASEGSNSIKVSAVDSKDPPKKISRKATNRSSQLTALAYHTPRRLLCAGASDGALNVWVFSEENALGSAKEEAAVVTPLFNAQTTQAPVVKLTFVACGLSSCLLVVAYQNRVVEVWDFAPVSASSRPREPYRVAVLHCLPPQATDFSLKNGELTFVLHAQAPLLMIHWHSFNGAGSCATIAELRLGYGVTPSPVSLSDWHEFLPAAPPTHEDGNAVLVFEAGSSASSPFLAYMSTHHHRQLLPLNVSSPQVNTVSEETAKLTLSTSFQLSVEQYFKYQDVPSTVLQVSRNPEGATGQPLAFQLQRYSQITGEVEKLDDLAVWNNYQGRQLLPWTLRSNEQQSALCIQLQDASKAIANEGDGGFSYVLLEVKAKPKGSGDADSGDGGGGSVTVTSGTPMDALDVCFCDFRTEEAKHNRPYVLLVLASSGKSIGFQMYCTQVDQNTRVLLQTPVQRLFPTPITLSPSSPHAELVGSRLLYLLAEGSSGQQTLVLSGDDLAVPRNTSVGSFTTRGDGERILNVVWNSGAASTMVSTPADTAPKLLAVQTTCRLIVLSASASSSFASLSVVAEYDLENDLGSPQSILWVAQSLLFVTRDQQLRFVTPLRSQQPHWPRSHLLCSLATDVSAPLKTQLVSLSGDRLCYTLTDPRSLECRTFLRPIAVCEPLLLGFTDSSDGRLKAILERDFLVFLLFGGQETRSPVTDKLLDIMYHTFGWTETVTKLLDALLNPSTAAASAGSTASSGGNAGGSGSSGSYKKLSHLSPATVASMMLHSHKWRDAVRAFLSSDPALEEYALAEDDASSAAKLPSRTGKTAQLFQKLAAVLASVGQAELAIECLDVAGDDLGILELLKRQGLDQDSSQSLLSGLQKDWNKLYPPLTAITKAAGPETVHESAILRRHDLFSLLCCEHLTQTERRSRLLSSVRPLDKLTMSVQKTEPKPTSSSSGRAGISYWKRLAPEDTKDTIGTSTTPHFSSDEPKNPTNYSLFTGSSSGLSSLGGGLSLGGANDDAASAADPAAQSSSSNDASAKMTIGPFLEDEDAVVAYWRFEEGSTASDDDSKRTLESMDTTKRENHLQVLNFASLMAFATSTAPVDKGEDGKLQEAFSLRFPSASLTEDSGAAAAEDWGAKCAVRPGSTLDIGFVFDDDPYRRKLTCEAWIRNFVLFRKQQEAQENDDEGRGTGDDQFASTGLGETQVRDDAPLRRLISRRGFDKATWWEFGLCDGGHLCLSFGGHTLKSEDAIANAACWQHVAFSIDIASPKIATLKLFVQARCVATKEISNVDANAKPLMSAAAKALAQVDASNNSETLPPPLSTMHLGLELTDYEMTEVRVWATARTPEQLSDMKENYLGIAEAKRRMKITIHQRNCQCEKCLGRRTNKTPAGKVALLGAPLLPSTPPSSAATTRDRRRPQPKA